MTREHRTLPIGALLVVLATLTGTAGCHLGAAVDAVIVDGARTPGDHGGVMMPLAGAHASLVCPGLEHQLDPGTSDGTGHYGFTMEQRYHKQCVLTVEQPGYQTVKVVLGDVCPPHEDVPSAPYCARYTIVVVDMVPAAP